MARHWPVTGSVAVLVGCPVLELLTGSELLYSLLVPALLALFWALTRLSRREVGLQLGQGRAYLVALLYPVLVIEISLLAAAAGGGIGAGAIDFGKIAANFFIILAATLPGALLTEDGFFRGWLWGAIERSGRSGKTALVWTSFVFALWHLPVVLIEEDFKQPPDVIPVYLVNAMLLGLNWGVLRLATGSVLVATVSHALWNAGAYAFFGFGTRTGELGIDYRIFGPERGFLGLLLNAAAFALLWRWYKRTR